MRSGETGQGSSERRDLGTSASDPSVTTACRLCDADTASAKCGGAHPHPKQDALQDRGQARPVRSPSALSRESGGEARTDGTQAHGKAAAGDWGPKHCPRGAPEVPGSAPHPEGERLPGPWVPLAAHGPHVARANGDPGAQDPEPLQSRGLLAVASKSS